MTNIDYAYELFSEIKEKKISFSYGINKKINSLGLTPIDVVIVKDCLKSVVNRYYFLKSEVSGLIEDKESKEADVLVIALGLARYARNIHVKDVIGWLKESKEANNYSFDVAKVEELLNKIAKNPTPVPEKYEKNFVKKIALLYSYPEWIVGMMKKHFGTKNTFKTISDSRKSAPINICVNSLRMSDELPSDSFKKTDIASTSYEYISKTPLVENQLFKQKKVFVMDQMEQLLADELEISPVDNVLIIGGHHGHLATLSAIKGDDSNVTLKVNFAARSEDSYMATKKMIDQFGIKSINLFVCEDINLVCTHLPYGASDKVLVTPPNSEFGLIRQRPEILITFDQKELDGLIEGQKRYIEEAAKFVKEDGIMIYSVPTLNIKESFGIVNEFIVNHEEFEMLEEKVIFPYMNKTSGLYYAKLRKKSAEE
jgi:16S rRNA (cytosine967-C5)-methyltransferase